MNSYVDTINLQIEKIYDKGLSDQLIESMNYSLQAGGKRIRPVLLLTTLEMFGSDIQKGLKTAAAIEMIHTYSLIHDDLPAMDDDDYRRGKLTNHKVFGEATAVLAGDALLTDSFAQIMEDERLTDRQKVQLALLISQAAGSSGMVGGQMLDMKAEEQQLSYHELEEVHLHKTGELIRVCFVAAGIIAERSELDVLSDLGRLFGLIFQIKDDILDVEGNFEDIGKTVGSDEANQKSTYVSLLGLQGAKDKMQQLYDEAVKKMAQLSDDPHQLTLLLDYIVKRTK